MPEFEFDLPDDEPLFDEPFTLSLKGVGKYGLLDRGNPPDEDVTNPETKPRSYFVELIAEQMVEEDRDRWRADVKEAMDASPPLLLISDLAAAFGWISETRAEAEKARVKEKAKRPTGGRSRSRASSSSGKGS